MPGGPELLIILAIVLLIFGGAKLPKLARSLGEAQKEFRHGLKEGEADKAPESSAAPQNAAPRNDTPAGENSTPPATNA